MGQVESTPQQSKPEEKPKGFEPPENDYQLVFEAIKDLEYTLMANFDSTGDNLHEMISTTSHKLPLELIVDMRALATIRNNLAHEYSCEKLADREEFIKKYVGCVAKLDEEIKRLKAEEETFYNEVVQKHRQQHPRPTFPADDDITVQEPVHKASMCAVACF
jgi:hypothetical protein